MRCSHGISDLLRTSMIHGRLENRVFGNGDSGDILLRLTDFMMRKPRDG